MTASPVFDACWPFSRSSSSCPAATPCTATPGASATAPPPSSAVGAPAASGPPDAKVSGSQTCQSVSGPADDTPTPTSPS